ncbi:MAG: MBL fold metallo-hydrolase [Eggerthellaceae bacterium]|jgi:glyoxylase-like metal-dependent hydrolase (beta-lactamase superfamily II)
MAIEYSSGVTPYVRIRTNPAVYLVRVYFDDSVSGATNCYVIDDGDERLIVDAGMETILSIDTWMHALRGIGGHPKKVTVFLTHLHRDHASLIPHLYRTMMHDVPVLVPRENYEDFLNKEKPEYMAALTERRRLEDLPDYDIREFALAGPHYYSDLTALPTLELVEDGTVIQVGRYLFKVIVTSGHTQGHACLYSRELGLLFSGDHILTSVSPVIGFELDTDSEAQYLDSLERMNRLHIAQLLPGHGEISDDAHERIVRLANHRRKRLARVYEIVAKTPGITGGKVINTIGWNPRFGAWAGMPLNLRMCLAEMTFTELAHLESTGHIKRQEIGGLYRYEAVTSFQQSEPAGMCPDEISGVDMADDVGEFAHDEIRATTFNLPAWMTEVILNRANASGVSANEYLMTLIADELNREAGENLR